jgi:3-hydroxyisobutyrate dehydrogenase-like beta-hydroxyacid dehydrogenase
MPAYLFLQATCLLMRFTYEVTWSCSAHWSGANKAFNPADVVSQAKTMVTMLPASAQVMEVYKGINGHLRYTVQLFN